MTGKLFHPPWRYERGYFVAHAQPVRLGVKISKDESCLGLVCQHCGFFVVVVC